MHARLVVLALGLLWAEGVAADATAGEQRPLTSAGAGSAHAEARSTDITQRMPSSSPVPAKASSALPAAPDVLRDLEAHLRARGASAVQLLERGFVFENQALAHELTLTRAGCVGVLAWGSRGVRDVDLTLYASSGQVLSEDRGAQPYGYARLCGERGLSLFASAQLYGGRGEITLLRIDDAPRVLGALPASLALSVAAGGRAATPRQIGGEDAELGFEAALLHEERTLANAGYAALGPPQLLEVRAGVAQTQAQLRGGACYRVVAFVPGARGMMLEVAAPIGRREGRTADGDTVRLAVCAVGQAPHLFTVRTRSVRGAVLVRVFEQPDAKLEDALRYGEERALTLAEARLFAKQRGMQLRHLGEVWLESGRSVTWPVTLTKGQCLVVLPIAERGVEVDVRLLDGEGVVLAHDEGRSGFPKLFTCAHEDGRALLGMRGRGNTGPVSVWVGRHTSP